MAVLTFETPRGYYCDWDDGKCPMYNDYNYTCEFFNEFLQQDEKSFVKCNNCLNLGRYGTSKKLK